MNISRRGFLGALAAAAATAVLDPELLLWKPGAKTIFLPPPPPMTTLTGVGGFTAGDVFTINGVYAVNPKTRLLTEHLQQFVLTHDAVGDAVEMRTHVVPTLLRRADDPLHAYGLPRKLDNEVPRARPLRIGETAGSVKWNRSNQVAGNFFVEMGS